MKQSVSFLFFVALLLISWSVFAQQKQFVCTPCGSSCDSQIYSKAGSCSHCGMDLIEKKYTDFKNLSYKEVCDRVTNNPEVVLLDVRSASEFKGSARNSFGILRNAINMDVRELPDRINELNKYKNSEIIVYCSHSIRSPRASSILIQQGFVNVSNMIGGVSTLASDNSTCSGNLFIPFK